MDMLLKYEQENNIILPEVFKNFYKDYISNKSTRLIGTDQISENPEIKMWAVELLQENGIHNFLKDDDFIFMMHQGYMFWFFRADGNPDPDVFGFSESETSPKNLGKLGAFLQQYQ